MKLTSFKALKLAVIVICMLAAGICYSCSVKNRDIGPENMVMALEPDGGIVVEESAGIESPRQRDEPEGGAGTMSAGADGEHLRGQDCMPGHSQPQKPPAGPSGRRFLLMQRNGELRQKEQECRQDAQKYAKKFGRVY